MAIKRKLLSESNVIPFIDVLLVLLLFFMIAAPMMTSHVDLALPQVGEVSAEQKVDSSDLMVTKSGTIMVNGSEVNLTDLDSSNLKKIVRVKADSSLSYNQFSAVMATLQKIGVHHVELVVESV